jgi:CheY-specific phosphatase CheX
MFSKYFGQYLFDKKYLTLEQLHEGLKYQTETRLKLGVLAVNAGYITADEADKINEEQKKLDKKFGELAVDLGYLKDEQVEELLSSQKFGHLLLGQALVDRGYMTLQEFEKAINEYKTDYSISDKEFENIQKDDVNQLITSFIKFENSKNEKVLKEYIALITRNLIRFIDSEAVINGVIKVEEYECKIAAKQDIKGEISLSTFIEAEENSFIKFASKYAEEELSAVDEMAEDSVGEFLNLQNGIFLVNMSNAGIELEMASQEVIFNTKVKDVYKVSVDLSFGKVNILIKE